MKKSIAVLVLSLFVVAIAVPASAQWTNVNSVNELRSEQNQTQIVKGPGSSDVSISSTSNYRTQTPPLTVFPPYLPYWTHGGWGTLKAYFPNGPNGDDQVYERTFNPDDPDDITELRSVLVSLPYEGPLKAIGGMLNGLSVAFGGPDNFHHGRGFEIANSLVRARRPRAKPLLVFIDSNVDRMLLKKAGYAYVGKVGITGNVDRNWDHAYDAAVAEALPWDVDILLISGGMRGVTTGSNFAFPGAAGGYSQTNYSISLFGAVSNGITEGKGKAIVSAEAYRHWPQAVRRRRIPKGLYDRIRARPMLPQVTGKAIQEFPPVIEEEKLPPQQVTRQLQRVPPKIGKRRCPGVRVSQELFEMAGFDEGQRVNYIKIE